jgi:hypothetical protein
MRDIVSTNPNGEGIGAPPEVIKLLDFLKEGEDGELLGR